MLKNTSGKKNKLMSTQKTCTQMFTAALFVTAKSVKQPKCSSVGQCFFRNMVHLLLGRDVSQEFPPHSPHHTHTELVPQFLSHSQEDSSKRQTRMVEMR